MQMRAKHLLLSHAPRSVRELPTTKALLLEVEVGVAGAEAGAEAEDEVLRDLAGRTGEIQKTLVRIRLHHQTQSRRRRRR